MSQKLMGGVINLLSSADGAEVEISLDVTVRISKGFNINVVRGFTKTARH